MAKSRIIKVSPECYEEACGIAEREGMTLGHAVTFISQRRLEAKAQQEAPQPETKTTEPTAKPVRRVKLPNRKAYTRERK